MNTDKLKELALAATPGPWVAAVENFDHGEHQTRVEAANGYLVCDLWDSGTEDTPISNNHADSDFIAAANPATILSLIAQRDELLAALRACRDALLTVQHYRHPDLDSIANVIDDSINISDKAIAKAVQP